MLLKPMRGARPNRQHWSAKGLVGEWLFNEGCGTKAFDSSGNENHGSLTNMASPPTASSGWGAGRRGTGLRFDGSNDYVNCGADNSLNITDAITIEAWVKILEVTVHRAFIDFSDGAALNYGFRVMTHPDVLSWRFLLGDGTQHSAIGNSPKTGVWQHIAGTWDGSVIRIYEEGAEINSTNWNGTITYTGADVLRLGADKGITQRFKGSIDWVKIYNRALRAEEIAWDYINEYALYTPKLTLAQLSCFAKLGVITDPSIESLSVNRTMNSKTIDRTFESFTPERTFNLGV